MFSLPIIKLKVKKLCKTYHFNKYIKISYNNLKSFIYKNKNNNKKILNKKNKNFSKK